MTFHEFEVAGTTYTPSGDVYVYFSAYMFALLCGPSCSKGAHLYPVDKC